MTHSEIVMAVVDRMREVHAFPAGISEDDQVSIVSAAVDSLDAMSLLEIEDDGDDEDDDDDFDYDDGFDNDDDDRWPDDNDDEE